VCCVDREGCEGDTVQSAGVDNSGEGERNEGMAETIAGPQGIHEP